MLISDPAVFSQQTSLNGICILENLNIFSNRRFLGWERWITGNIVLNRLSFPSLCLWVNDCEWKYVFICMCVWITFGDRKKPKYLCNYYMGYTYMYILVNRNWSLTEMSIKQSFKSTYKSDISIPFLCLSPSPFLFTIYLTFFLSSASSSLSSLLPSLYFFPFSLPLPPSLPFFC